MKHKIPQTLTVDATITIKGIDIVLNKKHFPITYPQKIWSAYPKELKEILKDTLAHSTTFYIPQILKIQEINYKTARPLAEPYFYKNGIYDIPYCANVDGTSSTDAMKFFFGTQYHFADEIIKTPSLSKSSASSSTKPKTIIPFSFGKESMLSYALSKELGIEPILVTIIDPSHKYEYHHKKPLIEQFKKEMGVEVYEVEYNPGWFWEGRLWNKPTELGWGLHVTEYALLTLPFVHYFNAQYIIEGNEQSCNDTYFDREGWFIYRAGYDQHRDWTHQAGVLASSLVGQKVEVMSLVEPLYEIAETKILQGRYKEIGKYQMSCFAATEKAKSTRWCQNCSKCAYMFVLFTAFNIDPKSLGFTENLFDKTFSHLYSTFFTRTSSTHYYGSQGEMGLAFYYSFKNGYTGYTMDKFKKLLLPKFQRNLKKYQKEYMNFHPTKNIVDKYKTKIMKIYEQELGQFVR